MQTWTYGSQQYWGDIFDATCVGDEQAPVDINTSRMISADPEELRVFSGGRKLGPLVWSFHNVTVRASLSSGAGSWRLDLQGPYSESTRSVYFGKPFQLQSISFHAPSENTINGRHYDMEAQLLHTRKEAGGHGTRHLVTSVLLQVGDGASENEFLQYFWHRFPNQSEPDFMQPQPPVYIGNPYRFLLPRDKSFYLFNGSLTAPPCSPAVWVVFSTPNRVSAQQLEFFRASLDRWRPNNRLAYSPQVAPPGVTCPSRCPDLEYAWDKGLGMNARDVQDIGSRWVKHFQMVPPPPEAAATWSHGVSANGLWWCAAGLGVLLLAGGVIFAAMQDARKAGRPQHGNHEEEDDTKTHDTQPPNAALMSRDAGLPVSPAHPVVMHPYEFSSPMMTRDHVPAYWQPPYVRAPVAGGMAGQPYRH